MATILVIDDAQNSREATANLLRNDGHKVIVADNAWQGLGALELTRIDLILLDLLLPGMDGLGFLRDLRLDRRWDRVPVLVVSAVRSGEVVARTRNWHIAGFLSKGDFTGQELLDQVHGVLRPQAA